MVASCDVTFEGELMHQLVPAMPISGNRSFHVVRGSTNKHLLFSIGDSGQLYMIRPVDSMGQCSLTDIGNKLGIPPASVISALTVTQSPDLSIYIAFTVAGPSKDSASQLHVVRPTQPSDWESIGSEGADISTNESTDVSTWLLRGESDPKLITYKLYLGSVIGKSMSYPFLVAVYTNLEGTVTDIVRIDVNIPESRWSFDHSFELPEDPEHLIDACCGYLSPSIHGMFCLYESKGDKSLIFTGLGGEDFSLQVRPDAKTLATFVNPRGYTDLLVGGADLYHYPSHDIKHLTIASSGSLMTGLQQLFIAQEGTGISVITRNKDDCVVYQQFQIERKQGDKFETLSDLGSPVPLLTSERGGGEFTALFDALSGSQLLYILDSNGQLTSMEQSGGTRLWQSNSILVPSASTNREIVTFTTHVQLAGPNGASLPSKTLLLSTSSPVPMHVNGQYIYATTDGVPIRTDSRSALTIIHQVDDLSTVSFTIRDIPSQPETVLGGTYTYDPSSNILDKLESLNADKLRNAILPDGRKLLHGSIPDSEIENAANMLSKLRSSGQTLANTTDTESSVTSLSVSPGVQHAGFAPWDIWHWLTSAATSIKNWFVEAWEFVLETAEGVYRFALKAVSHVMKAISWVFERLQVSLQDLVKFFGFCFDWSDILDMHNILVGVTNCALDVVVENAESCASRVDSYFGEFETIFDKLDPTSERFNHIVHVEDEANKKAPNNGYNTPGSNWSNYQLEHGGIGKAMQVNTQPGKTTATDVFAQLWNDVLYPGLEGLSKLGSDLKGNLREMFFSGSQFSFTAMLQHLGAELLRDLFNLVRKLTVGMIKFCGHLVEDLKAGLNATINIPLLSPLYRLISGGNELSLLDAIALLTAVPVTVSFKFATGKRPRDISSLSHLLKHNRTKEKSALADQMLFVDPQITSAAASMTLDQWSSNTLHATERLSNPSSFETWIHGLAEVAAYVVPHLSFLSIFLSARTWYQADIDTEPPNPPVIAPGELVWEPASKKYSIFLLVCAVFCFPRDIFSLPPPLSIKKEPAPVCRIIIWILETANIPCKMYCRTKLSTGLISFLFSALQAPFTCILIYEDITADKKEFPDRNAGVIARAAAQNGCSQVAKIANACAILLEGEDPWSAGTYMLTSVGTTISQHLIRVYDHGRDHNTSYTSFRNIFV